MKKNSKGSNNRHLSMAIILCLAAAIGIIYLMQRYMPSEERPAARASKEIPVDKPKMVRIPAGEFKMGVEATNSLFRNNSMPAHMVQVEAFDMDKTEVTVEAYAQCIEDGSCTQPKPIAEDPKCNYGYEDRMDHPINCVNWDQARAYCEWKGGRLPSEAEWEYAARGGHDDWLYPWGNDEPGPTNAVMGEPPPEERNARTRKDSVSPGTRPVGSKKEFGYGLCDMGGNVEEWVQDDWHLYYDGAPTDGSAWVSETHLDAVTRGGWWISTPHQMTVYHRYHQVIGFQHNGIGFRCARDAQEVQ